MSESAAHLKLTAQTKDGDRPLAAAVGALVIAGWTGRNREAMEAHIAELEAIGIARPKTVPTFYRVAAGLLTTGAEIQVSGPHSSGEAETVILNLGGRHYVGVGSDHTDRQAETVGVSLSKQMCAKPVGPAVWPFDEVAGHWDELILRSWVEEDGGRSLYQEGAVSAMRPPGELQALYGGLPEGAAMFGGTLAVHGEIRTSAAFEMELEDPVLGRCLRHRYTIVPLPVEG
ncbi:MAG: DUF2848 domain-containing protein [Rhodospirillaceae bacterium]|nr:DUF2848 domain-containing protein [Rhodospirillaceae bacterium]